MTIPLLWVANEQHTFSHVGFDSNTSQTTYKDPADTAGSHLALEIDNYAAVKLSASATQLWFRARVYLSNGNSSTIPILSFVNSSTGLEQFAVYKTAGTVSTPSTLVFKYRDASNVMTTIGTLTSVATYASAQYIEFEFFFKQGVSGECKFYVMRRLFGNWTGDFTVRDSNFDTVLLRSVAVTVGEPDNWGSICIGSSQIPGIGCTVHRPNSGGGDGDWTGGTLSYNDINESTWETNYSKSNYTNATAQNRTYNFDNPNIPSGHRGLALVNCLEVMITSDATPTDIKFRSRQSTTSYDNGSTGVVKGEGALAAQKIMEFDNLGAAWTNTNLASLLVGFSSA